MQRSPRCKLSLPVYPSLALCHVDVSCADLVLCLEGDENVAQLFLRLCSEFVQRNRWDKTVFIVAVLVKEPVLQSLDNAVPVSGAYIAELDVIKVIIPKIQILLVPRDSINFRI